ncbi:uncharacterized protein LOC115634023 [Scaptodrosophila lebanonensis]|uniref:Uncharacterized protein LOC115634023 n=1 Tax=Drosophila lebanonensis TaxID=7225 RepID=A0A6J2UG33_DROLE|nr:uncharacterized protein LOC115634023 [Scaptodrosophila lebanonensis]
METLTNCCYFFSLQTGCILIAVLEATLGLFQIYCSRSELHDINGMTHKSTTEQKLHNHNIDIETQRGIFEMSMAISSIISSLLLLIGALYKRPVCLLIWLQICIATFISFLFYTLIVDLTPEHLVMDAICVCIDVYFWFIVLSYYIQLRSAQTGSPSEFEVLYTPTDV